jgi:serine/threonine protein kinase
MYLWQMITGEPETPQKRDPMTVPPPVRPITPPPPRIQTNAPTDQIYGTYQGFGIHGPVHWDQMGFGEWHQIGQQYSIDPPPNVPLAQHQIVFLSKYGIDFIRPLGEGGFGTLWETNVSRLIKDKDGNYLDLRLACKVLALKKFGAHSTPRLAVDEMLKESNIHSALRHPNIVNNEKIFYLNDDLSRFPAPINVLQFMELCDGNLKTIIDCNRRLTESRAREWFVQIVDALRYLHEKNVVHLDIKPHNILYKQNPQNPFQYVFKLSDFGLAEKFIEGKPAMAYVAAGTQQYMAPEMVRAWMGYDPKAADIYSLGVSLAESLSGRAFANTPLRAYPFRLLLNAAKSSLNITGFIYHNIRISYELADLLLRMTDTQPTNRLTVRAVHLHMFVAQRRYVSGQYSLALNSI